MWGNKEWGAYYIVVIICLIVFWTLFAADKNWIFGTLGCGTAAAFFIPIFIYMKLD
jgi:hypothetical protein